MEHLINVRNVSKTYGGDAGCRALKNVSLQIDKGEFVSVTGSSGSGKSTLMHIIGGLDYPDSGEVVIDNMNIGTLDKDRMALFRREYVGFVFQQFYLVPTLNALQNVTLPLTFKQGVDRERMANEALKKVGISNKAKNLPSQLSGGEAQRVAIARAMVNEPYILMTDEPTGNLDSKTGKNIMELLLDLNGAGHTIIQVTHNPAYASYAQRIIELKDGEVVKDG
jgi:putative ABC transport system ATP-binding protein